MQRDGMGLLTCCLNAACSKSTRPAGASQQALDAQAGRTGRRAGYIAASIHEFKQAFYLCTVYVMDDCGRGRRRCVWPGQQMQANQ
jgi:hypothetical protein